MKVVYCATERYFDRLIPSIRSLLKTTPTVEAVYVISDVPFKEGGKIHNIVTDGLEYFPESCPNRYSRWTYMSLMRLAFHRMFPDDKRIVYLDCDTIVVDDIGELDHISFEGNLVAGVKEPKKSTDEDIYINAGVVVLNLAALRATGMGDRLIGDINTIRRPFPDQDCINAVLKCSKLELPCAYNMSEWTGWSFEPRIMHYAAYPNYQRGECKHFSYYQNAANDQTDIYSL